MNDNVKISFIPKKPLAKGEFVRAGSPIFGLTFIIATSIVVLMVIIALGEIGWKEYRTLEKNKLIIELKAEVEILETTDVFRELESIRALERRIKLTSDVLSQHIASSRMLEFVEETTLPQTNFKNYDYVYNTETGYVNLTMDGIAPSFADLAAQSAVYRKDGRIQNFNIDKFVIREDGGVQFNVTMYVSDAQLSLQYGSDDFGPSSDAPPSVERARAALRMIESDVMNAASRTQPAAAFEAIDNFTN
jgi:hypothetical protein